MLDVPLDHAAELIKDANRHRVPVVVLRGPTSTAFYEVAHATLEPSPYAMGASEPSSARKGNTEVPHFWF